MDIRIMSQCEGEFYYTYTESPLGKILLISDDEELLYVNFADTMRGSSVQQVSQKIISPGDKVIMKRPPVLAKACGELESYFKGELTFFSVPYRYKGTAFQERVWLELTRIPYGQTVSYSDIAFRIGRSQAVRAIGRANHENPLTLIIPCHRVIGKKGDLVGYGGGIDKKAWLLEREKFFKGESANAQSSWTISL